ncbi:thiamine phosphate synthase [Paenibacillus thailandensis]|uniref:Thiamine-phosphate synthase n=1 Tax=Paenibacillus thailandensis TaxID=393250 RepID=A0ABW5R3M0_9BACL
MAGWNEAAVRRALRLYFIAGSVNCSSPLDVLRAAIEGGATMFQYREKGAGALEGKAKLALGMQLRDCCREAGIPFIVNDDIELAIALDADGIHVGQEDAPAGDIRRLVGAGRIVGVSAHTVEEARQAIADGADYLGIGPIFPTSSKDDARAVQGTRLLEELRNAGIALPLVAIGGLTADNAAIAIRSGADGVSVISAVAAAPSPRLAVRQLLAAVASALQGR